MDIKAIDVEYDYENDAYIYSTGLSCETDYVAAGYLFPKSRNYKTGSYLANAVGIVDTNTYRGEIKLIYKNRTSRSMFVMAMALEKYDKLPWYKKLKPGRLIEIYNDCEKLFKEMALEFAPYQVGDAVAQLVLTEIVPVQITEVKKLGKTKRGQGGFGSTKSKGN